MESLQQSFKNSYLFKLGSTSFIYPDLYSENVRMLGPYLDEIELLLFESLDKDSFPDEYEMKQLAELKETFKISYNVHMPTDVNLASPNPSERSHAAAVYYRVYDLFKPLDPSTLTLHLSYDPKSHGGESLWQAYAIRGVSDLLQMGVDSRLISVETLDYPIDMLKHLIEEFDLSVCLDVGHVILHGGDPLAVYEQYKDRISIMHLHGVHQGCDHVSLDLMDPADFTKVRTMLEDFTGTVSLEVFSFENLKRSLDFLREML